MAQFKPFEMEEIPLEEQPVNWKDMVPDPYDKKAVDPYTRTRVILMNGIENNADLMSHAIARMHPDPEVKRAMALMRRIDSQQQVAVNMLNPADQSVIETTLGYEQVAVDLTANLAQNEPDPYVKQTLDFALLEDFDHLYRYSCLYDYIEGGDPEMIVRGQTEVKPGRPTNIEHRHPDDSMRRHYDKDTAEIKTKMNYVTIVAGEQQTMLYYRAHGFMYPDPIARQLYAEITEIEEQHVSQYENLGDPRETMLEKMALIQLNEAYLYYSYAQHESDPGFRAIWERFMKMEIAHFNECARLIKKHEGRDIRDIMKAEVIEPLIVFESNKDYVNRVIDEQLDLAPHNMVYTRIDDLPDDWASFGYQRVVNAKGAPSEEIVGKVGRDLAMRDRAENIVRVKQEMARRVEKGMAAVPAR
ncbi:MAG: hypothetical protein GX882_03375 [Methanomicrobiales archaeon]|nr:hypothetical protein [Methanomicrobiales archaeon]